MTEKTKFMIVLAVGPYRKLGQEARRRGITLQSVIRDLCYKWLRDYRRRKK